MTSKELNAIAAQLAAQVATKRRKCADIVPPGWFTAQQLREVMSCDISKVLSHLKLADAERKKFLILCGKSLQAIPHYKLK